MPAQIDADRELVKCEGATEIDGIEEHGDVDDQMLAAIEAADASKAAAGSKKPEGS